MVVSGTQKGRLLQQCRVSLAVNRILCTACYCRSIEIVPIFVLALALEGAAKEVTHNLALRT